MVDVTRLLSTFGSVVGASAMGHVIEHGGMGGTLGLTVGSMLLTAPLTMPFLQQREERGKIFAAVD